MNNITSSYSSCMLDVVSAQTQVPVPSQAPDRGVVKPLKGLRALGISLSSGHNFFCDAVTTFCQRYFFDKPREI